jgi:hypothetical protein
MKYEIKNRWTRAVKFTAEIDADENTPLGVKIGLAVKWAISQAADLTRANLTRAKQPFVPPVEDLDGKILAAIEAGGTLKMDNWHSCETTHCRAGWAITISPVGRTLESIYGSSVAGALIYSVSYPKMRTPDFHASNEDAMNDIKARAALAVK